MRAQSFIPNTTKDEETALICSVYYFLKIFIDNQPTKLQIETWTFIEMEQKKKPSSLNHVI